MLNIPSEVMELFKSDSVQKIFHVKFPNGEYRDLTNADIVSESVSFTESLCSAQYLKFGLTEASQISFECVGVPNVRGAVIWCAVEIDVSSLGQSWIDSHTTSTEAVIAASDTTAVGTESGSALGATVYIEDSFLTPQLVHVSDTFVAYRVPYGEFIVDSCPRNHGQMARRRVTAYGRQVTEDAIQIYGAHKNPNEIINAQAYLQAATMQTEEMTEASVTFPTGSSLIVSVSNSSGNDYVSCSGVMFGFSETIDILNKVVVFDINIPEHPYDELASNLLKAFNSKVPSGYMYSGGIKTARNAKTNYAVASGGMHPMIRIQASFTSSSSFVLTYPIILAPNQNRYVIDPRNLVPVLGKLNGAQALQATVIFPYIWQEESYLMHSNGNTPVEITDWAITEYAVRCDSGDVKVRYKFLDNLDSNFDMQVENTLEAAEPFMGAYYTYGNAFNFREMLSGYYELNGVYGKQVRDGSYTEHELVAENPYSITTDMYSDFWWEEYDVEAIGKLEYEWDDGKNQLSGTMSLGTDGSIYSFSGNYVLQHLYRPTEAKIQNILQTYFVPKIGGVVFTPIDLNAVGLPYLESGDYITLTSQDGETIYSYILDRTINGIQALRDTIASTGGEVIS